MLEPQLVHAPVDLFDGPRGAAPAEGCPGSELAGMLSYDAGQMVVNAGGPGIGLVPAQQLGTRHTVAQHRQANAELLHTSQLGVHIGVAQGGGVPVSTGATHEIGTAFQHSLGQCTAPGQVLQVVKKDEMAVDINTHGLLQSW